MHLVLNAYTCMYYLKMHEEKARKMDVRAATFSQRELCQITGLDTVTVDTWLIRGNPRTQRSTAVFYEGGACSPCWPFSKRR